MMVPTLLTFALLAPQTQAFSPETPVPIGIEPHRVWYTHDAVQGRLAQQPAFQAFVETDAPQWQARFDEVSGAPVWLWGQGISVPTHSADALTDTLIALLDRHPDLFRHAPGTLQVRTASYVDRLDTWYVDLDAPIDGRPIYRGGFTARVKHGRLISLGALSYGDRPTEGDWTLSAREALSIAIEDGPVPSAAHSASTTEAIWLPIHDAEGLRLVATWQVRTRTHAPPGKWVSFVDADTGELLSVHNEVRFAEGLVTGWHAERTVDGSPLVQSALPLAVVSNGIDLTLSDEGGAWSLPDGAEYTTDLNGDYVNVVNGDGPEALLTRTDTALDWTVSDATQAEISSYIYVHQIHEWGAALAPELEIITGNIRSTVNLTSGSCNAYFDGNLNFYAADSGCANTGEIRDVNHHEWGHGFHLWSVESTWFGWDGSLSEGAADVVAFFQSGDNIIAPHFFDNGSGIRDVAPNRVYPDDYDATGYAVHSNGLIFGGAMWDLWHALMAEQGTTTGTEITEQIFAGLLKGGPDISTSYDEAMVADDDDGDLSNGTPHGCQIIDAFGQHGLGPLGDGDMYDATHAPRALHLEDDLPYPVVIDIQSSAPSCFEIDPSAATVHFRVDEGDWQTADLSVSDAQIVGEIPSQAAGSFVEYWIEVQDGSGSAFSMPRGEHINPWTYHVGPVLEIYCTDFEKNDAGFTHALLQGDDVEGADDWQHGAPAGVGGDPAAAWSGEMVWGNDLGWDAYNGQYQNNKKNRLSSPVIETRHYLGSLLSYRRWLSVEDALYDQARISVDGEVLWKNWASAGGVDHHLDQDWAPHALPLGTQAEDGEVELSWTLTSDGGLGFGGWTVDDVCLYAPDTPDNRLGISGIVVDRDAGGAVHLSWNNPLHDPVEAVLVFRSTKPFSGGGASDRVLVWSDTEVELGGTGRFIDTRAPSGRVFYAVYATDGTHMLSWTREGFNTGSTVRDGSGDASSPEEPLACGCSQGPAGATWVGLLGLGLVGLRRRR